MKRGEVTNLQSQRTIQGGDRHRSRRTSQSCSSYPPLTCAWSSTCNQRRKHSWWHRVGAELERWRWGIGHCTIGLGPSLKPFRSLGVGNGVDDEELEKLKGCWLIWRSGPQKRGLRLRSSRESSTPSSQLEFEWFCLELKPLDYTKKISRNTDCYQGTFIAISSAAESISCQAHLSSSPSRRQSAHTRQT